MKSVMVCVIALMSAAPVQAAGVWDRRPNEERVPGSSIHPAPVRSTGLYS